MRSSTTAGGDGRGSDDDHRRIDDRGQLSTSVLEAGVGVALILAVTVGFAVDLPEPAAERVQLEAYAEDAATLLASEPPRHGGTSRLGEVVSSAERFRRERASLRRRVERILPANVFFRVETPHGHVGFQKPAGVTTGTATVTTTGGDVTIRVWYG